MIDWDEFDEAAMREGQAIKRSLRSQRPRKPHGVRRDDVGKQAEKEDLLKKLNIIGGKSCK